MATSPVPPTGTPALAPPTITGNVYGPQATPPPPAQTPPPDYNGSDPLPLLTDARRQQLDGIVQQMMANKESDADISFVVKDFKQKYSPGPPPTFDTPAPVAAGTSPDPALPAAPSLLARAGTFASGFDKQTLSNLNPIAAIKAVLLPIDTYEADAQQRIKILQQASSDFTAGHYGSAAVHALDGIVPILGPIINEVGQAAQSGDPERQGRALANLTSFVTAPEALRLAASGVVKAAPVVAAAAKGQIADAVKITPQLDPAEAAAVQYGHDEGVQMPTSVQTGSKVAANAEAFVSHVPFSSGIAKTARAAEQSTLGAAGDREVAALGNNADGPVPTPLDAGDAINSSAQASEAAHNKAAGDSYSLLRSIESQPEHRARVQTGTRQVSAGIDEEGNPAYKTVPVHENVQLPVDYRGFKKAIKPLLEEALRPMSIAQEQNSTGIKAMRNIVSAPDFVSASTADQDLGALKGIIRDSPQAQSVGIAKLASKELDRRVTEAVTRAGPDALAALKAGRESTVAKYAAQDFQKKLGFKGVGTGHVEAGSAVDLAKKLTRAGDRSIDLLRSVAAHAPEQLPALAQAAIQELLDGVTAEAGMSKPQSALRAWMKMGPETKRILFGDRTQALTNFFTLAKKLSENPNPSGTGTFIATLKAGGMLLFTPHIGVPALLTTRALARVLFNPTAARNLIIGMKLPAEGSGAVGAGIAKSILSAAGEVAKSAHEELPRSGAPEGAGESGAAGAKRSRFTTVEIPGKPGSGYKAEYKIVELGDSQASHSGLTFQPNPKAALKNVRDYANQVNQRKIVDWASRGQFKPEFHTTLAPDALNGPPVEDAAGQVLAGNGRHMIQERVYAGNPEGAQALRDSIAREASGIEGLNPQDAQTMQRPSLRRVIADEEFARRGGNARQNLIADTNVSGTANLTPAERAISDSRRVSTATLDDVAARLDAAGPKATIADALEGKAGGQVLQKLIDDGVVSPQEQAAFVNAATGELTKGGRDRIGQLMIGRFFSDPEQMDAVAPSVRARIERIAAPLAQVEAKPGWDLTPDVRAAVDILVEAKKLGVKNVDDFIRQDGLFGKDKYSAEAVSLAKSLQLAKSDQLTAAARQYAQDAAYADKGAGLLGDAPTPAESFQASFGALKSGAEVDAAKLKAKTPAKANPDDEEPPPPTPISGRGSIGRASSPIASSSLGSIGEQAEATGTTGVAARSAAPTGGPETVAPVSSKALGDIGGNAANDALARRREGGQKGSLNIPGGETGPHGPIFREYAGDWEGARDRLLAEKTGEAPGALVHPDLPPADLVWGEEGRTAGKGFGLAKIAKWHASVLDKLGEIYSSLPVVESNENTIQLDDGRYHATIRRNWQGSPKNWLLTEFDRND